MRLSNSLFVLFATYSIASPLALDATPISNAFKTLSDKMKAFDARLISIKPESNALQGLSILAGGASEIMTALNNGIAAVNAAPPLTVAEAAPVGAEALELAKYVETSINTLISKKEIFVKAKQASAVGSALRQERDTTKKFADAVISKLPADVAIQTAAKDATSKAIAAIEKGVSAFS